MAIRSVAGGGRDRGCKGRWVERGAGRGLRRGVRREVGGKGTRRDRIRGPVSVAR